MSIFNSLEFDGVNSLDDGVYITGESVYDAPERDVEVVEIAGRNGNFLLDKGRWKNIEVTYRCGTFGQDQTEFGTKMRAFRNKLASKIGYMRLTDTYHPDEFRMGTFKSALEVNPVSYKRAGEFDVKFDCKPQRWLTEGEQEITVGEWGQTETVSGDIVEIENPNGNLALKSLDVAIEPAQDLNGYDHPWAGGAGKNKLQNQATSQTINGITWTVNSDGTVKANGTATAATYLTIWGSSSVAFEDAWEMTESMRLSCDVNAWTAPLSVSLYSSDGQNMAAQGSSVDVPAGRRIKQIRLCVPTGQTASNVVFKPMLRASDTEAGYEPYENICPISGRTEVETIVSSTTSAEDGTTYTTSLGRTVYGGTLDVVSGELTVTHKAINLGTLNWNISGNGNYYTAYNGTIENEIKRPADNASLVGCICSCYVEATTNAIYNGGSLDRAIGVRSSNGNLWVRDTVNGTSKTNLETFLSGKTFCYELAEPQTYQLTPQQVELLTGTNNIWSDGDITAEYGQDPDALYNPTPYDASPLLMVEGYGTIGFSGYEITLQNVALGDIRLTDQAREIGSVSSNYVLTAKIKRGLVEVGDTLRLENLIFNSGSGRYVGSVTDAVSYSLNPNYSYTYGDVTLTSSNMAYASYWTVYGHNAHRTEVYLNAAYFTVGTASSVTGSITTQVPTKDSSNAVVETAQFKSDFTIAYDGNDTITLTVIRTITNDTLGLWSIANLDNAPNIIKLSPIYANSTVSLLGDPTYIDCDLGDAYMIKDGSYISLNSYIDLGSDLPVLASGNNEITIDNTITELKIVPRWWIL